MATGDADDILNRITSVLPPWFIADETPILDGLLAAYSNGGVFNFAQAAYVDLQTRITTATDDNLDLIANDFFGSNNFNRNPGESDESYRNRILACILRERATRRGMILILTLITGTPPRIFEPRRAMDCGGYSVGGMGYSVAGGYTYRNQADTAYQCFITVYTPVTSNIAYVAGWGIPTGAWSISGTRSSWVARNAQLNALNQAQIYQAINDTKVLGTLVWSRSENAI